MAGNFLWVRCVPLLLSWRDEIFFDELEWRKLFSCQNFFNLKCWNDNVINVGTFFGFYLQNQMKGEIGVLIALFSKCYIILCYPLWIAASFTRPSWLISYEILKFIIAKIHDFHRFFLMQLFWFFFLSFPFFNDNW